MVEPVKMTNTERKEYTDGLRAIANWYDKNPKIEITDIAVTSFGKAMNERIFKETRDALGLEPQDPLIKYFGPVKLRFIFWMDEGRHDRDQER